MHTLSTATCNSDKMLQITETIKSKNRYVIYELHESMNTYAQCVCNSITLFNHMPLPRYVVTRTDESALPL